MTEEDFPTSPSKRRRTESPPPHVMTDSVPAIPGIGLAASEATEGDDRKADMVPTVAADTEASGMIEEVETTTGSEAGLLDILMAQVEAQAGPGKQEHAEQQDVASTVQEETRAPEASVRQEVSSVLPSIPVEAAPSTRTAGAQPLEPSIQQVQASPKPVITAAGNQATEGALLNEEPAAQETTVPAESEDPEQIPPSIDHAVVTPQQWAAVDPVQAPSAALELSATQLELQQPPAEKEWETDSSPYSSSTDSSDSSDSEDDDDGDYPLLSPSEQARVLMEDGGSDDEGGKTKGSGGSVKTANEKAEEVIPKPDITITPEMRIEELGNVEAVVEGNVLIKGRTTGEYQVLESGSVLCSADRTVLGVVADTMGRVEQPLYTIRFTNDAAIAEAGLAEKGTKVFYVHDHSTFVFTQPLKGIKGSDASNFHDEEVGDDEMEFSDDEKEAEHKRVLKLKRRGVDIDAAGNVGGRGARAGRGSRGRDRGGRGRGRGGFQPTMPAHPENAFSSTAEATSLNYDDGEVNEYEPLRRPSAMEEQPQQSGFAQSPPQQHQPQDNRRGVHRGRGQHNRGRGGRGGRGGFQQNYSQQQTSPIHETSPQQFQPPNYGYGQQQQPSWMAAVPPPPGVHMPNFFTPSASTFPYGNGQVNGYSQAPGTYAPNYTQQQGYGQPGQPYVNGWTNQQNVVQQMQQQMEEFRRQQQGGGQNGMNYG
jgi:H/ACA ribonucleoprotein complex non-core subunit NAF1